MSSFDTVLVANRGEIALRVMRTARRMGLSCVAVYSEEDAGSPYVGFADRAVCIGAGPAAQTYLSIPKILAAAADSGADAVHPGYGFLSENAEFAEACAAAGLVFIGPGPQAIALMGNKAAAKRRMTAAGVPCVPGYEGEDQTPETLAAQAARIGYPVMIKAAAGGGGKGMRRVGQPSDLAAALDDAQREARDAFGSQEVILEKALPRARHVEVQILADAHGRVIHLGERDCSLQRRHQKVVEEAPAPGLSPALRARMGATAAEAAQAVGYRGAGTVEFLLEDSGTFYFLEMNTRLQVEHPVTEMITGLDLVAQQINIARGDALGLAQEDVQFTGHAIEARLYAEDPAQGFLPQAGRIALWQPPEGDGLRVDEGIAAGQVVPAFYDPMLAKVIAHGATREEALQRLIAGLRACVLFGPACNRDFLIDLLTRPEVAQGGIDTGFIARGFDGYAPAGVSSQQLALAAALIFRAGQAEAARAADLPEELLGWTSQGVLRSRVTLEAGGQRQEVTVAARGDVLEVTCAGVKHVVSGTGTSLRLDGTRADLRAALLEERPQDMARQATQHVAAFGRIWQAGRLAAGQAKGSGAADSGRVTAPMHGSLLMVCAKPGDRVEPGSRLAVLEAMKMQHEILAAAAGTVVSVAAGAGAQVRTGDLLVEIAPAD